MNSSIQSEKSIATHTPGEWKTATSETGMLDIIAGTNFVCRVGDKDFPSAESDARLIAAAPDLLAAVAWLSKSMQEYQNAILAGEEITLGMTMRADGGLDKARAAIAKAAHA